jgi:hypothetical protein
MKKLLVLAGWLLLGVIGAAIYTRFSQPKIITAASQAPAFQSRKYYLTKGSFPGNQAATEACTGGYHMASIFEVSDTAALQYDTTNGLVSADSGNGPPSYSPGWIRSGASSSPVVNCSAWTSASSTEAGTNAFLVIVQDTSTEITPAAIWRFETQGNTDNFPKCAQPWHVWCVQD